MNTTEIDYGPILDVLTRDGAAVLDPQLDFFEPHEWDEIERLSLRDAMPYETVHIGDAGEPNKVEVGRIMTDVDQPRVADAPVSRQLLDVLVSERRMEILARLTGRPRVYPRRAQVNLMHEGSFIGLHLDQDSNPDYEVAVVLQLGQDFEGGEFVVHPPSRPQRVIHPAFRSVTISRCDYPHEVRTVTGGVRASLVFFVSHHADRNRRLDA